jgi:hypothetical protein
VFPTKSSFGTRLPETPEYHPREHTPAGCQMVERSLFRVWLSYTFNNLQVTDGCVSSSKYVQVILIMGRIVGCGPS